MSLPVHQSVGSACELIGLPLPYMANAGKCIHTVPKIDIERFLNIMKKTFLERIQS